ncbi:hypothetical protein [Vitreimonas sp.]|uniref:hypothetical protein n=1 Tax=Vitreimonas sp. TaxID=3069702 RepID=UPI002ED9A2EE
MKFLIGAAAATLLMASPALAQTPDLPESCTGFAAPPTLPDGATADRDAITGADAQFREWHGAGTTKLGQCRSEVEAARARVAAMEAAYNAAVAQLNGTRDAWVVEVEEFNARAPRTVRGR